MFVRIVLAEEESLCKLTEDQLLVISYIVYIIRPIYCKPPVHIPQYEQEYENIEMFSAPTPTNTNDIPTNECSAYGIVVQR